MLRVTFSMLMVALSGPVFGQVPGVTSKTKVPIFQRPIFPTNEEKER